MKTVVFTIENDNIVAVEEDDQGTETKTPFEEGYQINEYMNDLDENVSVLKSSSLDFPLEFTSNLDTIDLAKYVNHHYFAGK